MDKSTWELAQNCPPCSVYQYQCELCPFFKKPDRCLLNTDFDDLDEDNLI